MMAQTRRSDDLPNPRDGPVAATMDRRPPRARLVGAQQRPANCRTAADRGTATALAPADQPPSWRVVAQRLCDLLLQFPAAAIGGVEWQTLARKYEERHGVRLDIASLGHGSPLAAATALLWDVLRLVDSEDEDNPVVAAEDAVVLTPRPGFLGTWPSIYHTLCEVVQRYGSADALPPAIAAEAGDAPAGALGLLLSHLKPLVQSSWHPSFDESGLGFLSEAGTFVRMRKMKHLVQAVLRWRAQRNEWQRAWGFRLTEADRALLPRLELVASKKQTDLVLVFFPEADSTPRDLLLTSPGMRPWLPSAVALPRRPLEPESFDDPYEPPPQKSAHWPQLASPCGSSNGPPSLVSTQVSQTQSFATLGTSDLESRSFPVSPMRGSCGASCSAWTGCLDSGAATPSKHFSGAATVEAYS